MKAIAAIDRFVLERAAQPVADLVMRLSGRSCYWLAAQAALEGGLAMSVEVVMTISPLQHPVGAPVCILLNLFYARCLYREAARMEDRSWRTRERSNWARPTRLWVLFLAVDLAIDFHTGALTRSALLAGCVDICADIGFAACSYFLDCRPRAPAAKPRLATEVA